MTNPSDPKIGKPPMEEHGKDHDTVEHGKGHNTPAPEHRRGKMRIAGYTWILCLFTVLGAGLLLTGQISVCLLHKLM